MINKDDDKNYDYTDNKNNNNGNKNNGNKNNSDNYIK